MRQRITRRLCEVLRPEAWAVDDVLSPKWGKGVRGSGSAVLRGGGQAGHLPGRGQRACRNRHRFLPAGLAVVSARGVDQRCGPTPQCRRAVRRHLCGQDPARAGPAGRLGPVGAGGGYRLRSWPFGGFRLALENRGLDHLVAVEAKEVAHAAVHGRMSWPMAD
ncbi:hypothetical protein H9Y04_44565 [Streptomyces sp. TRM66268-LWL]|uniref:Transposase n=1 Tax=Streptomyces polyasparticus TaxID=2767826 RepID=A0ABR7SVR2_9ACTN|nr:hypothetical protein [Streptomyces polyasparticus]